ncbi:hypothetical protein P43SY_001179 [Pythium insidiosum]|uniref:Uncharacterized protein n=1 Tax=Pythium insidiosum TaxID=114742 RepID=A0AAD5M868_PYTIN|nr:hypothetical protein P43SY_001179 [Pythium insidiosum]
MASKGKQAQGHRSVEPMRQEMANASSAPRKSDAKESAPVCVVRRQNQQLIANGSAEWVASAGELADTIELRHHHQLERDLPPEKLDQLLAACHESLHTLLLEDCVVSDQVLAFLAERLAQYNVRLSTLTFRNGLGPVVLEELDISRNGITSVGLGALIGVPVVQLLASDNAITSVARYRAQRLVWVPVIKLPGYQSQLQRHDDKN